MGRQIPRISLADFELRREDIKAQLCDAATTTGFFILYDQKFPSIEDIEKMFYYSSIFFTLPQELKDKYPFEKLKNTGYEFQAQVRPSTGTKDLKESLQLQFHRRNLNWPSPQYVGESWNSYTQQFMLKCQDLSMDVLGCLAEVLDFDRDFFSRAHNIDKDTAQTTLRLLHYNDITGQNIPENYWRAGAHTDFDCMTLLFQRNGEDGLEVCPGREAHTDFAIGDSWTPIQATTGEIVVNIGDMLMSWSDDKFKSNFHRVRAPKLGEDQKERYSIAFFNQTNTDVVIEGPMKKYPPTTGREYIENAMKRNYALLQATIESSS